MSNDKLERVARARLAEIRHWFFQTLTPEQRQGFFYAWVGIPKDISLTLGMQYQALDRIAAIAACEAEAGERERVDWTTTVDALTDELERLRNERAQLLNDIAVMMSEFVDNWPKPKKVKTALALIAKTLRAALNATAGEGGEG